MNPAAFHGRLWRAIAAAAFLFLCLPHDAPCAAASAPAAGLETVYSHRDDARGEPEVLDGLARVIRTAPRLWPGFDLERPILVGTDTCLLAHGIPARHLKRVFQSRGVKRLWQRPIKIREVGSESFLRVSHVLSRPPVAAVVNSRNEPGSGALGELARELGQSILLVDSSSHSRLPMEQVEHLLIHEGFHFFYQGHESRQPSFLLADRGLEGREALEWLFQHDAEFRRSADLERALDLELALALDSSTSRSEIVELLDRIFEVLTARWRSFGTEEIEKFWYTHEGIATHVGFNYRVETGQEATPSEVFRSSCGSGEEYRRDFFALCGGAILWHALDRLWGRGWQSRQIFTAEDGYRLPFKSLEQAVRKLYPAVSLTAAD